MMRIHLLLLLVPAWLACAGNPARPLGEPVLDPPTLHCLGVYWIIGGDDNRTATVAFQYRPAGTAQWQRGMDLFRVEKGGNKLETGESLVCVPAAAWLFAGSAVGLVPDTDYELRLTLHAAAGRPAERLLTARTRGEPVAPPAMRPRHVRPGNGGGTGTVADPFNGLAAAQQAAQPGDLFLLHGGVYEGPFNVTNSGEPNRPIVWRAAGGGEAVIDGRGAERVVAASDTHDVWFERLTMRGATWGLVAHAAQRIVIRRCQFHHVKRGITATRNPAGRLGGFFVADNSLEGPHAWAEPQHGAAVEENRGIELGGAGNVICYNRVHGFKDGIDLYPSVRCVASDVHNNEVSECLDDGCEMDGAERNCRCFLNRFTNVFQGISVQPVCGGPVYIFRNAIYNFEVEAFKMHNSPSGALFLHNTCVKHGPPLILSTRAPVHNCVLRNNLFLGTGGRALDFDSPMIGCDCDYDGFGGATGPIFLKWNNVRYATLADVKARAPVEQHATIVDPASAFAAGLQPPADPRQPLAPALNDLRLKPGTAAIDAGTILPGFNDEFTGTAPDLGAYELGSPLPHYGPRAKTVLESHAP